MSNWDKPFWRSTFSEEDGTGSVARLGSFLVLAFALLWVSYLLLLHRALPPLGELSVWVASVTTSLYGVNKIAAAVAAKKDCD